MTDQRNVLIAIVLSIAIILGFDYYTRLTAPPPPPPSQEVAQPAPTGTPAAEGPAPAGADVPAPPSGPATDLPVPPGLATVGADRPQLLAQSPRVRIDTPALSGSISLTGGLIDDLTLRDYRITVEPDSPNVELLSPGEAAGAYFASLGWIQSSGDSVPMPDRNSVWRADGNVLTPDRPLTLTWDNGAGLVFKRVYEIDERYMFSVTQRVENAGGAAVTLHPYGLISRLGTPPQGQISILHEGPLGVFHPPGDDQAAYEEIDYEDVREAPKDARLGISVIERQTRGGWLGFADHYWLVALVPNGNDQMVARFSFKPEGEKYQVDYLGAGRPLEPGSAIEISNKLFAGAKVLRILEDYSESLGIDKFPLAIDFGWFYFLAKPIFRILHFFNSWIGNFGVSILFLTLLIKIIFFPLANKSYRAMGQMKKLQPEMLKLRDRFKDDKQRLNQEMMALYKREKVNPASGCLPMVVQIPVFIALYQLLFATIEMRHAPFFWWIQDLSAPDPTNFVNLFGLLPFSPVGLVPDFLLIGIWPLIMGGSMFLQQRLNPTPPDPIQAKIFMFLPIIFTFMLARFPSGLVIYWTWNNILSIAQQWIIMKRAGAFDAAKKKKAKV